MRQRVRALVVGAGLMGRWHTHAIRRAGGVVAGVVDVDAARAKALASRVAGAQAFPRLEAALAALQIDVVHVCTPSSSHGSLIRTALDAGCHVLAEKPLAATAEETRDLLELAAGAKRILVPVHQFEFQRGILQLMAAWPVLGPIVHLEAACGSAGAVGGSQGDADAIAADILPHFLGLTRRLTGVTLAQQPWTVMKSRPGEWRVTGQCGGISIGYLVSMGARPTFAELHVFGESASARADLFHGFAVLERGRVSRVSKAVRPFRLAIGALVAASQNLVRRAIQQEPAYPGLAELVRRVHLAAMGRGPTPILPADTLDVAKTRDQLMAQAGLIPAK